jgi:adenine-specific DNA-methyltransferase
MEDPVRVTNLYAAFLVRAIRALSAGGQLVAITPRSFANGPYFRALRAALLDRASFERVHVFETRDQVFADADVLQENVVFSMRSGASPTTVVVSSSEDALGEIKSWECSHSQIVRPDDEARFVRLPLNEDAIRIAEQMLAMPATLANLGIRASTGRVVDFRSRSHLLNAPEPGAVPLVYPHNVRAGCIVWPLPGRKSQALAISEATERLLLPNEYYVIVKRFSAKEEPRRVVAALSVPEAYDGATQIGFENHLNVFHKAGRGLDRDLAVGLAHYLNSDLVDDYIRQFNGHTQINATDLHELRYPSLEQLRALGGSVVTPSIPVEEAADQLPFTSAPTTESSRAAA